MFSVTVICRRLLYTTALLALLASSAAAQQTEPDQLYGSGVDAKGNPTYFRVRLPSVAIVDIGPNGFPFPLGTAYDTLHDRYYWIELDAQGEGTLWVSQGVHGRPTAVGATGQFVSMGVMLAYNPVNSILYGLAAGPERATSVLFAIDPATAHTVPVAEYAGYPTQVSCDHYNGCVYCSAAGQQLLVYAPPGSGGSAYWAYAPADRLQYAAPGGPARLHPLDRRCGRSGSEQAGAPARLRLRQSGVCGPVDLPGADHGYQQRRSLSDRGTIRAPSETGDLYGYGTDERGNFTHFRFSLQQAEAEDIGADAFPFPLDAAYDPVHDVRYSANTTAESGQWTTTLYAADGHTGRTTTLGTLSQSMGWPGPALAYQPSSGFLYAASWKPASPEPLWKINPATLDVAMVGQDAADSVGPLCWNPQTGALYGVTVDSDGVDMGLVPLDTQTGQRPGVGPGVGIGFEYQWAFFSPVFDPSGRYLYVVGYQNGVVGFEEPPHLLVFDLESPPGPGGTAEPVVLAPLSALSDVGSPAIGDLFFAPAPKGVDH